MREIQCVHSPLHVNSEIEVRWVIENQNGSQDIWWSAVVEQPHGNPVTNVTSPTGDQITCPVFALSYKKIGNYLVAKRDIYILNEEELIDMEDDSKMQWRFADLLLRLVHIFKKQLDQKDENKSDIIKDRITTLLISELIQKQDPRFIEFVHADDTETREMKFHAYKVALTRLVSSQLDNEQSFTRDVAECMIDSAFPRAKFLAAEQELGIAFLMGNHDELRKEIRHIAEEVIHQYVSMQGRRIQNLAPQEHRALINDVDFFRADFMQSIMEIVSNGIHFNLDAMDAIMLRHGLQ